MKNRNFPSKNSPTMRRIVDVVSQTPGLDGRQIAEAACCTFNYFMNQGRWVLIDAGEIHISGYRNNSRGPFVPLYDIGPAKGEPPAKPEKIDQLARARAWKVLSGYYEAEKAKRRLRRPDPVLRALLGMGASG